MSHLIDSIRNSPYSLPVLSGILLVVIQPPVPLSFLAFFALIPLLLTLEGEESLRRSSIAGGVTGAVSFLGLIYWVIVAVHKYGGINIYLSFLILLLFVVYLSVFIGVFALTVSYLRKKWAVPLYLSAPPAWVLLEYVRGLLLTGFPWSFLGHSQYHFLPFIQIISITGSYYLSFLIMAVNCIFFTFLTKKRVPSAYVAVIGVLLLSTLAYGYVTLRTGENDRETLKAAIIQGNITQDVKWDEEFKLNTVRTYYQATLRGGKGADLVVWPETAMPFLFDSEAVIGRYIRALPAMTGARLLFGSVSREDGRFYNSAYVLGPDGREEGRYYKGHLVPFGEFTPLRAYLPFLERLSVQVGDFFSGKSHAPVRTGIGNIGILICYEGVFPYITRETVNDGAQVLVNITNDAWYDRTSAPYQHLSSYVFRAIEADRYVLRAANTGISAIIDARGRIHEPTPLFTPATVTGGFALKNTRTFYVRYGDYFILLMVLYLATLPVAALLKKRGAPGPSSPSM